MKTILVNKLTLSLLRRPKPPVKSNGALKNHIFVKQAVKDTKVASKQPLGKCSMFSITLHHNNYRLVHENTEWTSTNQKNTFFLHFWMLKIALFYFQFVSTKPLTHSKITFTISTCSPSTNVWDIFQVLFHCTYRIRAFPPCLFSKTCVFTKTYTAMHHGNRWKKWQGFVPYLRFRIFLEVFGHLGILSKFWPRCVFLSSQLAKLPQNLQEILSKISLSDDL